MKIIAVDDERIALEGLLDVIREAAPEAELSGFEYPEDALDFVDEQAFLGTVAAHTDAGVPVITIDCGSLDDRKLGELFYFMELACGVSAYVLGVNLFRQTGVEYYKHNMFRLLGKPGWN